jgi:hypothetical protein
MGIDIDSKKFLEEAKKGKPRRFAMTMKGETILSLIVYKKGSVEKYKKQAKEEGTGQFYHGVIDGKGQNIVFYLCRADGFEEPPGKDAKLKMFLKDEAGMQFKPHYEIVDALPSITDSDEEESEAAGVKVPEKGSPEPSASLDTPTAAGGQAAKLLDALRKMAPLIQQALAADPARKSEILQPAASIKAMTEEGSLDAALSALVDYNKFLKAIASAQSTSTAPSQADNKKADGMKRWQAARSNAVEQLNKIAKAIAATRDPDAKGAIIELQSIVKNLTPSPGTPQQIAELDRYLREDDVITAAEEVPPRFGKLKIREPLLKALAALST